MRRYNGRLKLQRTVEVRFGQQLLRGTRIPAITAYKQKAPEGALSVNTMTQMPLPRRGDVAKRSASEPLRGSLTLPGQTKADHFFLLTTRTISKHCLA